MRIETGASDNKNIMHFYPEDGLKVDGGCEFSDIKSIRKSPLAENLMDLGGICSVMITPDCVSVVKENTATWETLKPQILAEILDFLSLGEDVVINQEKSNDEELLHKIEGLLNARIRPAIQKDGGDIKLKKYEDGVVYVELKGKCVGCPYAQRTLKDGVEKLLKTYIPEVRAVDKYEE